MTTRAVRHLGGLRGNGGHPQQDARTAEHQRDPGRARSAALGRYHSPLPAHVCPFLVCVVGPFSCGAES